MLRDHQRIVNEIQRILKEKTKRYAFNKLDREIIQTGACIECGSCVAGCPVDAINGSRVDGKFMPQLIGECISCGICYSMCPRTHVLESQLIGEVRSIWKVRSQKNRTRQDGGAVTAILEYMLESENVEGAVVAKKSRETPWLPEVKLARHKEDLAECGGTIYTHAQIITKMLEGFEEGISSLAVVGTPCNMDAIRRMEMHPAGLLKLDPKANVFRISLFCMESFNYNDLRQFLQNSGIRIEGVKRFAIAGGKLTVTLENQERTWPIADLDSVVATSCVYCQDFTGLNADISCGNIGSDKDWTTVIVRTARGEGILKGATKENLIEAIPLDDKGIQTVINSSRFKKNKIYGLHTRREM